MKYDFSYPDYPDNWILNVPNDLPQKFEWMPCLETCGFYLTVGKQYRNIGYSSMGDRITVFDDNNKMILANLKCFIKSELLNRNK
jgi:phosphomevalonate kinase